MIYLLHFLRPIGDTSNARGMAMHYMGYAEDGRLADRLAEHESGWGAKITAEFMRQQIPFVVAATWPGDRSEERRLKRWHKHPKLCPVCRAARRLHVEEDTLIRCRVCGEEARVSLARCLQHGWPHHHNRLMELVETSADIGEAMGTGLKPVVTLLRLLLNAQPAEPGALPAKNAGFVESEAAGGSPAAFLQLVNLRDS